MTTNAPKEKQKHLKLPTRSPVPKPYDNHHLLSGHQVQGNYMLTLNNLETIKASDLVIPFDINNLDSKFLKEHLDNYLLLLKQLFNSASQGTDVEQFSDLKKELQDNHEKIITRLSTQFAFNFAKSQTDNPEVLNTLFIEKSNELLRRHQ